MNIYKHLRPLIFCLPPEMAHNLSVMALQNRLLFEAPPKIYSALETNWCGLHFRNPVGLAAGFDKNARAVDGLLVQGFGFVEAGTVTPLAQPGNPQPRLFRLIEDEAVINRLGFNNDGLKSFVKHYSARDRRKGVAGANIGKNKNSDDAVSDYVTCMKAVYAHADYITVNVSSPNTQGLRDLQKSDALGALLSALSEVRNEAMRRGQARVPLLLKIAPDLDASDKEGIAQAALANGVEGLIISNTTVSRPGHLKSPLAAEQGGLSGRPLFDLSTQTLSDMYRLTGGTLMLIGVGGIAGAEDAYRKIRAGAGLVQLYSALVYQGFGLVNAICEGLVQCLKRDGFSHISEAVGVDAK